MVGHSGLARTMKRLKANHHKWEFMENHVRFFIVFCPQCQKMSMIKIPIHAHPLSTSSVHDGGYLFLLMEDIYSLSLIHSLVGLNYFIQLIQQQYPPPNV